MNSKTISILSYVTIIGWVIAYVKSKDLTTKNDLAVYHLEQGLGFFILSVLVNISLSVIVSIVPAFSFLSYIGIILLILWIFGIINAINEQKKPIPLVGKVFENKFGFLA
ncbi:MAG TPA: import component protein [Chryseobacterium sp.]|nr:import component protein [Chryseobacterium sp.]